MASSFLFVFKGGGLVIRMNGELTPLSLSLLNI